MSGITNLTAQPAKSGTAADDEEEDELDAFMAGIEQQVAKQEATSGKEKPKPNREDIDQMDDQEEFFAHMAQMKQAAPVDEDDEVSKGVFLSVFMLSGSHTLVISWNTMRTAMSNGSKRKSTRWGRRTTAPSHMNPSTRTCMSRTRTLRPCRRLRHAASAKSSAWW